MNSVRVVSCQAKWNWGFKRYEQSSISMDRPLFGCLPCPTFSNTPFTHNDDTKFYVFVEKLERSSDNTERKRRPGFVKRKGKKGIGKRWKVFCDI